jgi:tellurite methyltransferase
VGTKDDIRKNLSFHILRNNMKQKDFAALVGVSDQAVSNWLNGKNSIDIELVPHICKVLEISIDDLFEHEHNQEAKEIYHSIAALSDESRERVKRFIHFERYNQ